MKFALDTPNATDVGSIVRFSGWCLTDEGYPADSICLKVNNRPLVRLERSERDDLRSAFPDFAEASQGGFFGDLPMPIDLQEGTVIHVDVVARLGGQDVVLTSHTCKFNGDDCTPATRIRAYRLEDVLEQVPEQGIWTGNGVLSASQSWSAMVLDAAHFHPAGVAPTIRVLDAGPTNPYSEGALEFIDATSEQGVFLDLGCGIRRKEDIRRNGIYLDAVHFAGTDVVCTRPHLPFRSDSIAAVVSLSVFEHLPDPFGMAKELYRVLKPGGSIWIETAFMQPMHADPSHYFNMTMEGLLKVFSAFRIEHKGTLPHQLPSQSLRMQLEHALPHMAEGEWKTTFMKVLDQLHSSGEILNQDLGPIGRRKLAAGVYFHGRKPR